MAHLVAEGIERSFGDRHVLRGADLRIHSGDKIGLVGANGSGKSTLLAILAGRAPCDAGRVECKGRLAIFDQDPTLPGETVQDAVDHAVGWHRELTAAYEKALADGDEERAGELQARLDQDGWQVDHKIAGILDRVGAPPRSARIAELSGGELRRVALATCLLSAPDILLLDEPTNHLDADVVQWLEAYLLGFRGALLLVTHDRYLLEAVAERIVEVEDGECVPYEGSYGDYLIARAERQARKEQARDRLLRMVAAEAAWAARSPSARSTKQKARLQRLDALKEQVPTLQDRDLTLDLRTGVHQGATLLELHGVRKGYDGRILFEGLDLVLRPGDRLGVMGPNGTGKSTLLRLLRSLETPDSGEILIGPRASIGVLDQARTGLVETDTVFEAAGEGNDRVRIGESWVHVATFLERFAFTRQHFDQHVASLSGGERARLLIAKLMLQGATVLLLDEPTNDLDLLTLRVLEEALLAYDGAVVVVTHDRAFLDRVATQVLAFDGDGSIGLYASRMQAVRAREERERARVQAAQAAETRQAETRPTPAPKKAQRLSYKEKQELEELPERIDALEQELASLEATLGDPATYRDRADDVAALNARSDAIPGEIEALFARWEALSERA
jgi:ATP-binding cassette subfamily F protein uup